MVVNIRFYAITTSVNLAPATDSRDQINGGTISIGYIIWIDSVLKINHFYQAVKNMKFQEMTNLESYFSPVTPPSAKL